MQAGLANNNTIALSVYSKLKTNIFDFLIEVLKMGTKFSFAAEVLTDFNVTLLFLEKEWVEFVVLEKFV